MSKFIKKYGNKNDKAKLIVLILKSITAVLFGSAVVMNNPWLAIGVASVSAALNEVVNFYKWEDKEDEKESD